MTVETRTEYAVWLPSGELYEDTAHVDRALVAGVLVRAWRAGHTAAYLVERQVTAWRLAEGGER